MTEVKCWRGSSSRCVRPVDQQRFNCLWSSRSTGSCVFFSSDILVATTIPPSTTCFFSLLVYPFSLWSRQQIRNTRSCWPLLLLVGEVVGGAPRRVRIRVCAIRVCVCNPRARARLSICYLAETIQKKRRQVNVVNTKKRTDLHSRSGCSSPSHHFRRS